MARATTSREVVAYGTETVWGTPPASAFKKTRFTSIQPKQDKETTESQEINGSRAIIDIIPTRKRGGVTLPFELSAGVIDDFAPTLFGNPWATDVLKVGTTPKSVTIERNHQDITQFFTHRGCMASKLDLNIAMGRILNGSWDFVGKFPTSGVVTAGTGAYTAAPTGQIMDPITSVQLIQEGATPLTGVNECSISIVNNILDFDELGNIDPVELGLGEIRASGKIGLYLADAAYFTKFANHVLTSMSVKIGGASSASYQLDFAKVRLKTWEAPNQGKNNKVVQMFEWEAIDDATDSVCKLTRVA